MLAKFADSSSNTPIPSFTIAGPLHNTPVDTRWAGRVLKSHFQVYRLAGRQAEQFKKLRRDAHFSKGVLAAFLGRV